MFAQTYTNYESGEAPNFTISDFTVMVPSQTRHHRAWARMRGKLIKFLGGVFHLEAEKKGHLVFQIKHIETVKRSNFLAM